MDTEAEADIRGFLKRTGVRYPILVGGLAAIGQLYRTDELSVPFSILLDENATVLELIPGWSAETRDRLNSLPGIVVASASSFPLGIQSLQGSTGAEVAV